MKDIQGQIVENLARSLNNQREQQVIERLNDLGFKFSNRSDLEQFCRKRLTLLVNEHKKQLVLDGKTAICHWDDTPNIEFQWTGNTYFATATLGKL